MGILSSLKQWNDECNERGKIIEQQQAEERRLKKEEEIRNYIEKGDSGTVDFSNMIKFFATTDIDRIMSQYAPKLTTMLGSIYLHQEDTSKLHELEGRYEELKERYDELKQEYDKQNELIAEIAKRSALTR